MRLLPSATGKPARVKKTYRLKQWHNFQTDLTACFPAGRFALPERIFCFPAWFLL